MTQQQLEAILAYKNDDVISRFTDQFNVTDNEAEDIFIETKKFLYLCQLPGIFIPDELLIVDEMWHNFILFTKVYHQFCQEHFGRYFHHLPASKVEKVQQKLYTAADPEKVRNEFNEKLSQVIGSAYDHLGADTVVKWFKIYPQQYSKPAITALRKY
ncbi:glycine-rich domain-containing protein [Mucilaginibacter sp.]